jgi:metallothionein
MSEIKRCAHPACSCVPPEGEAYCSTNCQDAKDLSELACQCDHPGCQGEMLKAG